MKKILKGIFTIVSILCIAFSAFFVYSFASGNTQAITKIERGIALVARSAGIGLPTSTSTTGSSSSVSLLTSEFGLTASQARQVIEMAEKVGVNAADPAELGRFIAKNADKKDEIQDIASMYQAGQISESQAKILLMGVLDV